ncbi:MAG TPA: ATP-binding protein [Vicinamibacterales bacterium]|nr:ATP-binding protein [Vicinamibacterales bacterium]
MSSRVGVPAADATSCRAAIDPRAADLYRQHEHRIFVQTDRLFAGLMFLQWLAAIAAARWISARVWTGAMGRPDLAVWTAVSLGGGISLLPIALALARPGATATRYVIATAQMLMSSLLVHFTGGRIETHVHVFGSLAFLSFYRDWRVLVPATMVVAADPFVRGVYLPQSVFGVLAASQWRWLDHAGWVIIADLFLIVSCVRARREMRNLAERTAALYDSEERYHALVDRAEGIFLADATTKRVLECNAAFRELLGYDAEEAARLTVYDFDADTRGGIDGTIRQLFGGKWPLQLDRRYRHKDGSAVQVTLNVSALAQGTRDIVCGAVRDVTALRDSESQLRQAQKMEAIGQLAGGIAHDFNNLLTGILGYGELVMEQLGKDHPVSADVAEMNRAGQSAAALTRQLLTFSRRQVVQREVLDINRVLSNAHKMLQRLIGDQIELVLELEPNLRGIEADAGQLEQVIVNLAVNARDAMEHGGRLILETAHVDVPAGSDVRRNALAPGSYVMLRVTDTGCGMDRDVQAHVFEPFFTTKEAGKGTGLGLSTVYGIVKQSGGTILFDSAPGTGTTFRIFLPVAERRGPRAHHADSHLRPSRPTETLLLVEDETVVRGLSRRALQSAGYVVLEAASPREALRVAERHQGMIHLIVTDVVMPELSGPALVHRLTAQHTQAKVLFMSGYTDDVLAPHHFTDRNVAFLPKPFTPAILIRKVREVLDTPGDLLTANAVPGGQTLTIH